MYVICSSLVHILLAAWRMMEAADLPDIFAKSYPLLDLLVDLMRVQIPVLFLWVAEATTQNAQIVDSREKMTEFSKVPEKKTPLTTKGKKEQKLKLFICT